MKNSNELAMCVRGCCKRLMLANVLQLISFLSVLFAATIAAFLGVYR